MAHVFSEQVGAALCERKRNGQKRLLLLTLSSFVFTSHHSGTSFTLHMAREASNCTTATNYAAEGDIRDQPGIPAIPGKRGAQGPWLELLADRHTNLPTTFILTKTHCRGFCNGDLCQHDQSIHSVRSFMIGCTMGTQKVLAENGKLEEMPVEYPLSLVEKAVHLFRHPLDNIVSRFHLVHHEADAAGDKSFAEKYPLNPDGFHRWCAKEDESRAIIESRFLDRRMRQTLWNLPCRNEFFRYTQWHNLAFSVTADLNLPTLVIHYEDYATNYAGIRDRLLRFLDLPKVGEGLEFNEGKRYPNYYSDQQMKNIRMFLQEFASAQTWKQLERYDLLGES